MAPGAFDKRFILRLATMVESGLLSWGLRAAWADDLIARLDSPPWWLVDLSMIEHQPAAADALMAEAFSPPFEQFDSAEQSDDFLACLLLRHRRGEINWATFLLEGELHLDRTDGRPCEWLFKLRKELERHWLSSRKIEQAQREAVSAELAEALLRVEPLYLEFVECFRRAAPAPSK